MHYAYAIRIAIRAMEKEIQRLAVQANLYDLAGANTPMCRAASDERRLLREAVSELRKEKA